MSNTAPEIAIEIDPKELAIDQAQAVERMGDMEVYMEIASYFASHIEDSLNTLARAIADADMDSATRLAHSLKSNCATVGAEGLRGYCYTLEMLCREGNPEKAKEQFVMLAPRMMALQQKLANL